MRKSAEAASSRKRCRPGGGSRAGGMARLVRVEGPPVEALLRVLFAVIERASLARRGAARRLNDDDVGAQVAKYLAAEQGPFVREIKNRIWTQHRLPPTTLCIARSFLSCRRVPRSGGDPMRWR